MLKMFKSIHLILLIPLVLLFLIIALTLGFDKHE